MHFCHFNVKKQGNFDRSANSTSKNSGKSISVRKVKPGMGTPDNHRVKSKSKSTTKRTLKNCGEKKSKLTDTEKLYFEEAVEKV
jgi:hypothetical protein